MISEATSRFSESGRCSNVFKSSWLAVLIINLPRLRFHLQITFRLDSRSSQYFLGLEFSAKPRAAHRNLYDVQPRSRPKSPALLPRARPHRYPVRWERVR